MIPNQPVFFGVRGSLCGCKPDNYCQPIFPADVTNFLLPNKFTAALGAELLSNPVFAGFDEFQPIIDAYWSQDDSNGGTEQWLYASPYIDASALSKILKQTVAIEPYHSYKFSAILGAGWGDNCKLVLVGYNSDGTYEVIGELPATGSIDFSSTTGFVAIGFYADGTCIGARVTSVSLKELTYDDSGISVDVKDKDDNIVGSGSVIGFYDNFVWCQVNWASVDLEAGNCYRICLETDSFLGDNIFTLGDNGTFENNADNLFYNGSPMPRTTSEAHSGNYSAQSGMQLHLISLAADKYTHLKPNTAYKVSLWVNSATGGDGDPDNILIFAIQDGTGSVVQSSNNQIDGFTGSWKKLELDYTSGISGDSCLIAPALFVGPAFNEIGALYVDDIAIYEVDKYNLCSQPFCLPDKPDCVSLITYSNSEDAFGFIYPPDFEFNMRLGAQLGKPKYPSEISSYDYDTGQRVITFANSRKISSLFVGDAPEYIHDALRLAVLHDSFAIEGESYVVESKDYSPEWRATSELASVKIDIAKATQDTRNDYL